MYANIGSHKTVSGTSSGNTFDYLDKENRLEKIRNQDFILEGMEDKINPHSQENFFNQDFNPHNLNDPNSLVSQYQAAFEIDNNRGSQNLKSSNFYMLNLSPSAHELEHLDKKAIVELESRGLKFEEVKDSPEALEFFEEQKDQLIKLQLKLYTQDVMNEYARQMNREIYVNQDQLPDNATRKKFKPIIEDKYNEFLKKNGFDSAETKDEKIEVMYKKALDYKSDIGKTFILENRGEEISVFIPNNKFAYLSDNSIEVDKNYFEEKKQEAEDKSSGKFDKSIKVDLNVAFEKETKTKSLVTIVSAEQGEIKLWLNNKDFEKITDNSIRIGKYQSERLIEKAVARDKIQKELVEIPNIKNTVLPAVLKQDGTERNPQMQVFITKVNGLKEPIELKFPKSEVSIIDGKFHIENYKYQYKLQYEISKGIEKEYGNVKDDIKNEVWKDAGFDVSKRKIERKDLLYFAKVEKERTYKHTDKAVIKNKEIFKELKGIKKNIFNQPRIDRLESQLLRDFHTKEVINEGVKKGGLNYHTHIVVSRHDKTSINPLDKVSMSPNANQKEGTLNNGAKVGFNRVEFFEKIEKIFDEKFEYERPEKQQFLHLNNENSYLKGKITFEVKNLIKKEIIKQTGLQTVKNELLPIAQIKQQLMPIPIPTSLPKNKVDLAIKAIKLVLGMAKDRGIGF